MNNKGNQVKPRKLLGIDELSVPTSQAGIPYTYFAGTRALQVTWIMYPVVVYQSGTHVASKKDYPTGSLSTGLFQKALQSTKRQTNLIYGHCAGRACLGQLDFIWGVLVNNGLAWPTVFPWLPKSYAANSIVAKSGRLYTTASTTSAIPPAAPWTLWRSNITGATANPIHLTVPTYGDIYLYYGSPDQTLSGGEGVLSAHDHPPYRNQAIAVLKLFQFSTESATPPSITLLGGRKPVQSLIVGAATDFDAGWQVNPMCVIAEILTHPIFGIGLPTSWFNAATWQTAADILAANPTLYYISPMLTSLKKVRDIVADLLGYADAYIFFSTLGLLSTGCWPHGEAAPAFDATNTVDRNNIIGEIMWDTDGWEATANSVQVQFQDIQAAFKDRSVTANNLFNQTITRRVQARSLDRPHVVRIKQAAMIASEAVKIAADQSVKGTATVRAEKATAIQPGSIFLLTDDVLQTSTPQRCVAKITSAAPAGVVKIKHETERGVSPTPYSATPENPEAPQGDSPARIANFKFFQMPTALAGVPNALGFVAGRSNEFTTAVDIYFQQADAAAFQPLRTLRNFAVAGVSGYRPSETTLIPAPTMGVTYLLNHGGVAVNGAVESVDVENQFSHGTGDGSLIEGESYFIDYEKGTITFDASAAGFFTAGIDAYVTYESGFGFTPDAATPQSDLDAISAALTADEILDNQFLIIMSNATDGVGIFSMCAFHATTLAGFYYVYALPAYGTPSLLPWMAHASDMFIIKRSVLMAMTHQSFPGLAAAAATANFILVPESSAVVADVTDIYDAGTNPTGLSTQTAFDFESIFPPSVSLISVLKGTAVVTNFLTTNFASTDVVTINAQLIDKNSDMTHVSLTAHLGSSQVPLWSKALSSGSDQDFRAFFSLPYDGVWDIICSIKDASGNAVDSTLVTLHVKTVAAPLPSPQLLSVPILGTKYRFVTALTLKTPNTFGGAATTGLTVKYQLVARGAAFTGSWTTVTGTPSAPAGYTGYGPIPSFLSGYYTLWVKSTKAASNDSAVVAYNL